MVSIKNPAYGRDFYIFARSSLFLISNSSSVNNPSSFSFASSLIWSGIDVLIGVDWGCDG